MIVISDGEPSAKNYRYHAGGVPHTKKAVSHLEGTGLEVSLRLGIVVHVSQLWPRNVSETMY